MSLFNRAVNSLSDRLVLVKDNKIVCSAVPYGAVGDEFVSVVFLEDVMAEKIKETKLFQKHGQVLTLNHIPLRFNPITGVFISTGFTDAAELEELFEYTRLVDSFYLGCGLVPDSFKDVEGYRSMCGDDSCGGVVLNQTPDPTAAQTVFNNTAKETIVFEDRDSLKRDVTITPIVNTVVPMHALNQEQRVTETHIDDTLKFHPNRVSDHLKIKMEIIQIKNELTQPNDSIVRQILVSSVSNPPNNDRVVIVFEPACSENHFKHLAVTARYQERNGAKYYIGVVTNEILPVFKNSVWMECPI